MMEITRLDRLAREVPRHSWAIVPATLKSSLFTGAVVLLELVLVRSTSAWLIGLGILLLLVHGAIAVSLLRNVLILSREIRRGLRGHDPEILTREFFERVRGEMRQQPWTFASLAVVNLAKATPFYPLVKYLFRILHTVHEEYYFEQAELELASVEAGNAHHGKELSESWSEVARYRSTRALSTERAMASFAQVG